MKPLCFVLMPFGKKSSPAGSVVDFDSVYNKVIAPAIVDAGLEPLRADEETVGGIIHKPMFERLILCPYAVADLTMANANVFYELGIRHAFRPWSTVPLVAQDSRLPFDVQMLRTVHYKLTEAGLPDDSQVEETRKSIANLLIEARKGKQDSPLFQLVEGLVPGTVPHEKTDAFREQVQYSSDLKSKLKVAKKQGKDAVKAVEKELGNIADTESGVVIDLFLSYRGTSSWQEMVDLVQKMTPPLAATVMVREQLGFALNRLKRRDEAEEVLTKLIAERGPSSETLGLLGRVYKDQWDDAKNAGETFLADGFLDKAIETYLAGFQADWRDAFPGINAVTLMEMKNPPDPRKDQILPVVRYGVERKIANGKPDYWDWATLLELAVLGGDETQAKTMLPKALACSREPWERETTARNLSFIRQAREKRGEAPPWQLEIEKVLSK
ncbi:MAG: TRAFs-binding domain-containing protein [Bryobacteraceae bacterium]